MPDPKVILLGGTSHAGKSTLARAVASSLGWRTLSTDQLARHPGRPWALPPQFVPTHVDEHYRTNDVEQLIDSVLAHYHSMASVIRDAVEQAIHDEGSHGLLLEGSALMPELVQTLALPDISAVWIVASDELLIARIRAESGYDRSEAADRLLIDRFMSRTLAFNRLIARDVTRLGLPYLRVTADLSVEAMQRDCLAAVDMLAD